MKYNFDLELILKMVEEGKMIKEIVEFYGCSRGHLCNFTRKHGLNFKNNKNARKNQSNLMNGDMNPTKGRKRDKKEMEGIRKYCLEKGKERQEERFKNGINYSQYAKLCRQIAYTELNKVSEKGILDIDHIFSIKDCWINKIHPRKASSKENLRLISAKENRIKGSKSDITLNQFLDNINVQRLSNAQFNWKQVE